MRNIGYVAVLLLLLLGSYHFFSRNYSGGTLVDRAGRDQVATVAQGDPDMVAAMRKARETLPEFLAIALAPRPTITSLAVKIAVPAGDNNEFFWISPFEPRDGKYVGHINNTPRMVKTVKLGQAIEFSEDEIVDWLYRENGKMRGNFTACALLKREPADQVEAMKKQYGLSCES
jgi:uncharacterized protein YegJ (DUF2314 family)